MSADVLSVSLVLLASAAGGPVVLVSVLGAGVLPKDLSKNNAKAAKEKERLWSIFNHSKYTPAEGRGRLWP